MVKNKSLDRDHRFLFLLITWFRGLGPFELLSIEVAMWSQ